MKCAGCGEKDLTALLTIGIAIVCRDCRKRFKNIIQENGADPKELGL